MANPKKGVVSREDVLLAIQMLEGHLKRGVTIWEIVVYLFPKKIFNMKGNAANKTVEYMSVRYILHDYLEPQGKVHRAGYDKKRALYVTKREAAKQEPEPHPYAGKIFPVDEPVAGQPVAAPARPMNQALLDTGLGVGKVREIPERNAKVIRRRAIACEACPDSWIMAPAKDAPYEVECMECHATYLVKGGLAFRLHPPIKVRVWVCEEV